MRSGRRRRGREPRAACASFEIVRILKRTIERRLTKSAGSGRPPRGGENVFLGRGDGSPRATSTASEIRDPTALHPARARHARRAPRRDGSFRRPRIGRVPAFPPFADAPTPARGRTPSRARPLTLSSPRIALDVPPSHGRQGARLPALQGHHHRRVALRVGRRGHRPESVAVQPLRPPMELVQTTRRGPAEVESPLHPLRDRR